MTTTSIVRVCLLILAGGFAAQHSRVPIAAEHCAILLLAAMLFFRIHGLRWIVSVIFGFTLFMHAANKVVDARLDSRFSGDSILTQVRIADFPKVTGRTVAMLIEPVSDSRLPKRSRVTWFDPVRIPAIGEVWQFELRLRVPHGRSNPGAFSFENWMFRERLLAAGYVVAGKRNRLLYSDRLAPLDAYRKEFIDRAGKNEPAAVSVLAAIAVGSRHLISQPQWERYAKTGSSHLMAISGLHIGLAGAAAFLLIAAFSGVCRLPGNHLDRATVAAVVMAATYALIAGYAVPSQRATIMLAIAAAAFVARRPAAPARIVALVAVLAFVFDPLSLLMPGFWLSFGAVVVLLWFAQRYWQPRVGLRIFQLAILQSVLLFGLMPLSVLIFQRIAFTAPFVNLVVVPVFSFVTVPLTLASMMLDPLWGTAGNVLLHFAAMSIHLIEWFITGIANIPLADVYVAGVGGGAGALMCVVLIPAFWVLLPRGWPGRKLALLGVLALLLNKPTPPDHACFDAHVLDVGQGLAVVVQSAEHTLLFDTGASYRGGGSAAEQIVLPFLRYRGIEAIDWLVISHADDDHAGGVSTVLRDIDVGQILAGEKLSGITRSALPCDAGLRWLTDGVEYRFVHPQPGGLLVGNDASCVLAISAGEYRLLLTGDIEAEGEQSLLRHLPYDSVDVALIPHHGSLTSSSPELINRLDAQLAIASVGYANRWGFPKVRVTKRWEAGGAVVLDTARSGAISFRLCHRAGVSQLREARSWRRRFWHDSAQH